MRKLSNFSEPQFLHLHMGKIAIPMLLGYCGCYIGRVLDAVSGTWKTPKHCHITRAILALGLFHTDCNSNGVQPPNLSAGCVGPFDRLPQSPETSCCLFGPPGMQLRPGRCSGSSQPREGGGEGGPCTSNQTNSNCHRGHASKIPLELAEGINLRKEVIVRSLCVHVHVCTCVLRGMCGELCVQVDLNLALPLLGYITSASHFLSPSLNHPLVSREKNVRMIQ